MTTWLARYMCLETHDGYFEGVMYTVAESGYLDDWGHNSAEYKIAGKPIDISKFHRVHDNIQQNI